MGIPTSSHTEPEQYALIDHVETESRLTAFGPTKTTPVFETFWRFAFERQEIFLRRHSGINPPFTTDPILREHRFTNVYRASDRVSQYLMRHVAYSGDQSIQEIFFRTMLFKLFNKIETWELLKAEFGDISWSTYSFPAYDAILSQALRAGSRIYSAAYIMPCSNKIEGARKHSMHLRLLESMMRGHLPEQAAGARSMGEAFTLLRSYPGIGDFLAYQYATDINYSNITDFSEMEFTIAGPGARDGISKCFTDLGGLSETGIIKLVTERQDEIFRQLELPFFTLWGRPLQLIDVQNLFCEVSKYSRVSHPNITGIAARKRIKQKYRSAGSLERPWYPPKWGINDAIANWRNRQQSRRATVAQSGASEMQTSHDLI